MYDLMVFLVGAVVVSLSGVMAPGPVTAATLAAGTRRRHAGGLIAVGHGVVELPLMVLIVLGMGRLFESRAATIGIGLVGGGFLLLLGVQMLRALGARVDPAGKYGTMNPVWIGVILTGGNPYFLLWWATVGLALSSKALAFGRLAFALFALVHWLCDLVWLEALSWASFEGSRLLGERSQRVVLAICGVALLVVGALFVGDAGSTLLRARPGQ